MSKLQIAGVDVSKDTIDVCIMQGDRICFTSIANTVAGFAKLQKWFEDLGIDRPQIVCEATGKYYLAFAKYFFALGFVIYVENPYKINKYADSDLRRTKTDKQDAKLIMSYGLAKIPQKKLHPWQPADANIQVLESFNRLRSRLKASLTAEKNRLHQADPATMHYCQDTIDHLVNQIKRLDRDIRLLIDSKEELSKNSALLQTIPGIGKSTASILLCYLCGSINFDKCNAFVSFCGLSPTQYQSGTSLNRSDKPKYGQKHAKTAFYMPAMKVYSMGIFSGFVQRLKGRGKKPMSIISALMRKLAVIAYHIIRTGQPYDPARYGS